MILHENRLPADDSHEISCLIGYFWKSGKIWNCCLLQIIGGALWVKFFQFQIFQIQPPSDELSIRTWGNSNKYKDHNRMEKDSTVVGNSDELSIRTWGDSNQYNVPQQNGESIIYFLNSLSNNACNSMTTAHEWILYVRVLWPCCNYRYPQIAILV